MCAIPFSAQWQENVAPVAIHNWGGLINLSD